MPLSVEKTLRKARRLTKSGDVALAAREYLKVLEEYPGNRQAADGLKAIQQARSDTSATADEECQARVDALVALYNQRKLDQALEDGKALGTLYPTLPIVWNILGAVNAGLGQLGDAVTSYEKALKLDPDYVDAHSNLSIVLNELGRPEEAMASCRRAIELKPDHAGAYNNLGSILSQLGNHEEAANNYRTAVSIVPGYAAAHCNLGNALNHIGEPDEALVSLDEALRLAPEYAEAHNNRGTALSDLGKPEDAAASHLRAIRMRPDFAEAHNNLGSALKTLGRFGEAEASYGRALEIRSDFAEAHLNLSILKSYGDGDPHMLQMADLARRSDLPAGDRMRLSFALGKAHDDVGDYAEAFRYLSEGNRLRKEDLGYDIEASRALFAKIGALFSQPVPSLEEDAEAEEGSGPRPVFVLGMPRSGTTLVEQILASHSQVFGAGELELLNRTISTVMAEPKTPSTHQLRAIRDSYHAGLERLGVSECFITDKMPLNFLWVGFIVTAMPEARIVHVRRDARATCWSNFKHYFSRRGTGFTNDLGDIARFYVMYTELMQLWHERFPGRVYDLQYETLTEHQRQETEKLLDYVGLESEPGCFEFHRAGRPVRTASGVQVRRKMYQGSSEEWRKYERHLGQMIQILDGI